MTWYAIKLDGQEFFFKNPGCEDRYVTDDRGHAEELAWSEGGYVVEVSGPRRTVDGSERPAVVKGARSRNNGRYNGRGRDWETPPEVFDPLNREFAFTLDPCATEKTAKCELFYTEAQDGLAQDWGQHRVFMNPPYGREVYAWTHKARLSAEAGALVVGLLPASTDLAWWHEDVMGSANELRFIRGRVRFLTGGPYRASGFFASVVVVWRPGGPRSEDRVSWSRFDESPYVTDEQKVSPYDTTGPLRWCLAGLEYPLEAGGDLFQRCTVLSYDRNKYVEVLVKGRLHEVKAGYLRGIDQCTLLRLPWSADPALVVQLAGPEKGRCL